MPTKKRLTKKQAAFTRHYAANPKASVTDSVIAAGYNVKNRQKASEIGSQLLKNTKVSSAISEQIQGGQYDGAIREVWDEVLQKGSYQDKFKAIEQIIKVGGLAAPQRSESRKISYEIKDLMPNRGASPHFEDDPEEGGEP